MLLFFKTAKDDHALLSKNVVNPSKFRISLAMSKLKLKKINADMTRKNSVNSQTNSN